MTEQQKSHADKTDTAKAPGRQTMTIEECKRRGLDPAVYGLKKD